jgi:hypothetical protein
MSPKQETGLLIRVEGGAGLAARVQLFIVLVYSSESGHFGRDTANCRLKMAFQKARPGAFKNSVELHPGGNTQSFSLCYSRTFAS